MKTALFLVTTLVSALGIGVGAALPGPQEKEQPAMPGLPQSGPQHAMLQKLAGAWDAVVIVTAPDGSEQRSKATMQTEKHGNFHTVDRFDGGFMGVPFIGRGINSYCPLRKKYVTFWTDSMSPTPVVLTGDYDEAKKELTMNGECMGPGNEMVPMRTVTRFTDADHYTFTMFGPDADGKEAKHLTIEYTRKK